MEGSLDANALASSFRFLIERHDSLRMYFVEKDGEVYQKILLAEELNFTLENEQIQQEQVDSKIESFYQEEFNLSKAPLLSANLLQVSADEYYLLFSIHHIIGDGWSMEVLTKELMQVYKHIINREEVSLPKLSIQYQDYVIWIQSEEQQDVIQKQEDYWLDKFKGEIPILELPSYSKRPLVKTYNGSTKHYSFGKELSDKLNQFSKGQGVTLYMTLLAGVNGLLYRYTNQSDIIIGTPIAGRSHEALENQVGLYLNTLAIRTEFEGVNSFKELIQIQKETLLDAYTNQDYPFDSLVEKLKLKRDTSRSALFDVMVVLQNQQETAITLEGLNITPYNENEREVSKFDMTFSFTEDTEGIHLQLEYNSDIYDVSLIDQLYGHLERFITSALQDQEESIESLTLLSRAEEIELLESFNDTNVDYPEDKTIIDLFRGQVLKRPEATAIIYEGKELSYQELEDLSNAMANDLLSRIDIEKDALIGVELERSEWLVVSLLAILKTGGAYVPIDPTYPEQRKDFIKEDSACVFIIDASYLEVFQSVEKITKAPKVTLDSNQLAYVIYTSGSTGKPKGVMIRNKSLASFISNFYKNFEMKNVFSIAATTSFTFDISVIELLGVLSLGKKIVLFEETQLLDPVSFMDKLELDKIDFLQLTPSRLEQLILVNKIFPKSLKVVLVGGEILSQNLKDIFLMNNDHIEFINVYGPTETTIWSTFNHELKGSKVTIGKPLNNEQVCILSQNYALQPKGVIGELCVSGAGLSRGYLNQPKLTAEKFIDHPFIEGERLYKTGDLARWLPDGNIEFIGRKDHQVKIRGYRIELGEIEYVLNKQSGVVSSVVVAQEKGQDKHLVAYLVTESNIDQATLKESLRSHLPTYMIPQYFMKLEALPLTSNGKIDRKALPKVSIEGLGESVYVAPETETEKVMASIWQEVLGVAQVGVTDNFFELGGHSLKVTQLINKINKELQSNLTVKQVFVLPTIKGLSKEITDTNYQSILRAPIQEFYSLTSSQRRLWVLSQFEGGGQAYNIPGVLKMEGSLDANALASSFRFLIERHDSLRMYFVEKDGEVYQKILLAEELNFTLENEQIQQEQVDSKIESFYQEEFNLSKAPLLSANLLQVSADEYYLLFSIHHIIGDGWSMEVLTKELMQVYKHIINREEVSLPKLSIQYQDYVIWIQSEEQQDVIQKQEDYWLDKFKGEIPILELPSYSKRPLVKTYNGSTKHYSFGKELSDKLNQFSKGQGVTLYMTLLAGVNGLLYRYTNQSDIIIGTPIAGRSHEALENQVGLYLNTLAIRTEFEGVNSFKELIQIQKETLLDAYTNQDYPFDSLVEKLKLKRDTSRSALFDVMVVLQNQQETAITLEGLNITPYNENEREVSKFDMTFSFTEDTEGIHLQLEYNSDIYDVSLIDQLYGHLERFITSALQDQEESIESLTLLSRAEEIELLESFNDTNVDYPEDKTIIDLFRGQVLKRPEATAIIYEGKELSYQELEDLSNAMANDLLSRIDIEKDALIGVELERSEWLVVSLLAILKTGGAYVPIDPSNPDQRKEFIKQDATCIYTIDEYYLETFQSVTQVNKAPEVTIDANQLAYAIFTSGSTGQPKGVIIEHKNVVRLFFSEKALFDFNKTDVWTMFHAYNFDFSVWEMYGALLFGGRLVIIGSEQTKDLDAFANCIRTHEVTVLNQTPSSFYALNEFLLGENQANSLRYVIFGGEALSPQMLSDWNLEYPHCKLINMYGITETTVHVTYKEIGTLEIANKASNIGKAIPTLNTYILNNSLKLQPTGIIGELCVSGAGLSRGYLNQAELTSEKFIAHPFIEGERLYRSGDLARWLPNGDIEYIGRKDTQVKLRGYRIELGEIEHALTNVVTISRAVVIISYHNEDAYLVAYVVAEDRIDQSELKASLRSHLPEYMIPQYFMELEFLPLTSNGKIDRKALPQISIEGLGEREYVAPNNETEFKLAAIWQEILGIEKVGVTDNFFELGGHSLKIIAIKNRIKQEFDIELQVKMFFNKPTIQSISEVIKMLSSNVNMEGDYEEITI
ncbi:non-ribosomal peptide synthetase [Nonlabens dokdonensis]|uniref:Amino acid adenylation domain-containing protein n=2 Tax=Nonlabens dokdonensis TaxID=328515 RepID=L7W571_NONDD|nr:non-ribosomal peptide synthetase [Nonlabens dokdonensis]AGC75292.1 amino acid adenylation domain-containing protein [Nonlabens dokdonensis DSW-6]